jgi:hypothetical protein
MEKREQTSDEKAPSFTLRTPLTKRLGELRQEVLANGVPLLSLEEIWQELQGNLPPRQDLKLQPEFRD